MSDQSRQALDAYIQRVVALKAERRAVPSEEELREIALEIGLSESDLAAVDQAAEDHFQRGQGFLEHRRLDDAITDLSEAVALSPRRREWMHILAVAHADRWIANRDFADRDRAEALARECLEIDPRHEASFEVLNRLDQPSSLSTPAARSNAVIAIAMSALLLTVLVASLVLWRSSPKPETSAAAPPATTGAAEPAAEPSITAPSELDIPLRLDPGTTGLSLELESRQARLKTYSNGKSFLTLNSILHNRGDSELDKLGARLDLLAADGAVVASETLEALSSADPVLRPGDAHALHHLRETSASIRQARFVVETVDHHPAATSYAPGEPLDFAWSAERPADLEIELRRRSYRFSARSFPRDGSGYFDLVLEVENTSQRTIRGLKIKVEIHGPEGRWTAPKENHVVLSSGPALRPGEVRLERLLQDVEEEPEGYELYVVEVR